MLRWWKWMKEASQRAGLPLAYREDTEQLLEKAGFVDISRKRIRIPFQNNPRDRQESEISDHYKAAMSHDSAVTENGFFSLSWQHLTRQLGLRGGAVWHLCDDVRRTVLQRDTPLYNVLLVAM